MREKKKSVKAFQEKGRCDGEEAERILHAKKLRPRASRIYGLTTLGRGPTKKGSSGEKKTAIHFWGEKKKQFLDLRRGLARYQHSIRRKVGKWLKIQKKDVRKM